MNKKLHRIYTNFQLQLSDPIILDSSTSNYVGRVLRQKKGDQIQCFDGQGTEAICSVSSSKPGRYELCVERVLCLPKQISFFRAQAIFNERLSISKIFCISQISNVRIKFSVSKRELILKENAVPQKHYLQLFIMIKVF